MTLVEYLPQTIWFKLYPIRYAGALFNARMTIIRLEDGKLWLHSPGGLNEQTISAIKALGEVAFIVAPGNYHHLNVAQAQTAFPQAETHLCPGIERKQPELRFDWLLGDRPPKAWSKELQQVLVRGTRFMWEVAFFHQPSRTLLLVDLVENFTDRTSGTNWALRFWMKWISRMWNQPKPAPEYQMGWGNRQAVRHHLERILSWDFQRVLLSHGEPIETDAHHQLRLAWGLQ